MNWKGVWVAMVTPFRNERIDRAALSQQVDRLLEAGVHGLCPCGTTGEGSALEEQEFVEVVETVLSRAEGKVPVVAGTGSNNTKQTVERTALAKSIGANGALVVTPYYVKPTQEGLVRHYAEIAKVNLPIMLYNVPSRTAVNLLPETVERLSLYSTVVAVKECAPLPQVADLIRRVSGKMAIFSGEDGVLVPFLSLGGSGIVSVAANLLPDRFVRIYELFAQGEGAEARKIFLELGPLIDLLFSEPNPIPVKAALEFLGVASAEVRSPLSPMERPLAEKLKDEMIRLGVLKG